MANTIIQSTLIEKRDLLLSKKKTREHYLETIEEERKHLTDDIAEIEIEIELLNEHIKNIQEEK